jgi:hypothetical protein
VLIVLLCAFVKVLATKTHCSSASVLQRCGFDGTNPQHREY